MRNNYKYTEDYKLEDLKYLIDNIPYPVWIKGSDGIYKYVNKQYAEITNMVPEDIIGKSDYDIRDEETSQLFLSEDREILDNEKTVFHRKIPVNMKFKNFFEVSRMILENNNKDIKLIGGIGRDITLNENLYKEIEESTLTLLDNKNANNTSELPYILKNTLKASGVTVFIFDEENKKMNIFLKTYNDSIIPKDYNVKLHKEYEDYLMNANNVNKPFKIEYNGKNIISFIKTYSIKYENELIGILNIHYDDKSSYSYIEEDLIWNTCDRLGVIIKKRILTNKYKMELQKRKKSEKKLQIFLENTIDFYIIFDGEQNYFENGGEIEHLEKFFGYDIQEIGDRYKKKILRHPDDEEKVDKIYKIAKECKKIHGIVVRYLCANNEYKSIEWNIMYISEDNKFFISGKDITSRLKLEDEKRKLEKTIELESLKTEFFANMSHEFKTPLNIILTTVQVLAERFNNSNNTCNICKVDMNRYLKGIKQNSYRLLKIVNNIMDITKIDSGSYSLELGNHNIVSLIEDIVLSVAEYITENKRNIIFDTTEEEIILACDPMKIERIILNLLSNALKYTYEKGNIEVFVDMDSEKNEVIISVRNDGDPIHNEDKEKIFERFTQSENLYTRQREGTGIGLFLVRLLVELHGGRIYVDTSELKGSKFVFILPIRLTEEKNENYTYTKQITSKVERFDIEFSDIYSI